MPTLELNTGFEWGGPEDPGVTWPWDSAVGTQNKIQSTIKRNGTYALRLNPAAGQMRRRWNYNTRAGAVRHSVGRCAIQFVSLPGATVNVLGTDETWWYFGFNASTGKLSVYDGTTRTDSDITVVAGTWYLIEWHCDSTANPWVLDYRVDGVAKTSLSKATAAADLQFFVLGARAGETPTYDVCYDDLALSVTAADYPIGDGRGLALLKPNGFGTHSNAADFSNDAGTSPPASTDWNKLDDVPMTSTVDYLYQDTAGAASYLEVAFEDMPALGAGEVVNGVQAMGCHARAGAGASDYQMRVRDGATDTTIFAVNVDPVVPNVKWEQVTPASAPWTVSAVDGLVARIGYGTDVTPFARHHALGLEVDVGVPAAAPSYAYLDVLCLP